MTYHSMQHMPVSTAYLCQDCDSIGNCSEQCPACASSALLSVAAILNRPHMDAIPLRWPLEEIPQIEHTLVLAHGNAQFPSSRAA